MLRPTPAGFAALLLGLLTACSSAPTAVPAPGGPALVTSPTSSAAAYLYIASKGPTQSKQKGMTTAFRVGQPTALRIARDTVHPAGIAVDHDGNVYVIAEGSLYVYAPGLSYLIRTVPGAFKNSLQTPIVIDAQNDVYFVASDGIGAAGIVEYSEGAVTLLRTIPVLPYDFGSPEAIAVDRSSNLYVASNEIQVYGPTGTSPIETIPASNADAIAVDSAGHVYADVCPQGSGGIDVYSPTGVLIRSKPGCSYFLSLDQNDYLYAGYQGAWRDLDGAVAVYKPYSFTLFRSVNQGIHRIRAMIVDPQGDLYVANGRGGTGSGNVVMYPPGKGIPAWTASGGGRNGVTYPSGLAVWQP
ncbi:MAG TPA: hypothetical protein VGG89_05315 [Candidatus Baltobacteraceae bacterium]